MSMSQKPYTKLNDKIDDETEGMIVLKGILKRKCLPLNTSYDECKNLESKTRTTIDQTYEESYYDRLFATARGELNKTSTSSSSEAWTPVVAPVRAPIPLSYLDTFDERKSELKTITSVNRMVYQDVESRNKRDIFRLMSSIFADVIDY